MRSPVGGSGGAVLKGDRRRWREARGEMQIGEKDDRLGHLGYFSGGGLAIAHLLGVRHKNWYINDAPFRGAP